MAFSYYKGIPYYFTDVDLYNKKATLVIDGTRIDFVFCGEVPSMAEAFDYMQISELYPHLVDKLAYSVGKTLP